MLPYSVCPCPPGSNWQGSKQWWCGLISVLLEIGWRSRGSLKLGSGKWQWEPRVTDHDRFLRIKTWAESWEQKEISQAGDGVNGAINTQSTYGNAGTWYIWGLNSRFFVFGLDGACCRARAQPQEQPGSQHKESYNDELNQTVRTHWKANQNWFRGVCDDRFVWLCQCRVCPRRNPRIRMEA